MMPSTTDLFTPMTSPVPSPAAARLPLRDRASLPRGTRFGPAPDGFEVVVTDAAATTLREGTRAAAPREAFGILMGRAFVDRHGPYTVVSGVSYATPSQAGPGHVRLTPEEMAALQRRGIEDVPAADPVGWTHSHGMASPYSEEDRREQATWPEDSHIGIVTFMRARPDEPWAAAYRGPRAEPVPMARTKRPVHPAEARPGGPSIAVITATPVSADADDVVVAGEASRERASAPIRQAAEPVVRPLPALGPGGPSSASATGASRGASSCHPDAGTRVSTTRRMGVPSSLTALWTVVVVLAVASLLALAAVRDAPGFDPRLTGLEERVTLLEQRLAAPANPVGVTEAEAVPASAAGASEDPGGNEASTQDALPADPDAVGWARSLIPGPHWP